ncbi:MAG: hypothetical protein V1834_02980 [Candidatus Micrarchaeota archaeon]
MTDKSLIQLFTDEVTRLHSGGGATAHELSLEIAKKYAVWGAAIAHKKGKVTENDLKGAAEALSLVYTQALQNTRSARIMENAKRDRNQQLRRGEKGNIAGLMSKHKTEAEEKEKQMAAELKTEVAEMRLHEPVVLRIEVARRLGEHRVSEFFKR